MTCEHFTSSPALAEDSSPISSLGTRQSVQSKSTHIAARYSESEKSKDGFPGCTCTRETFGCGIHPTGRDEWIASQRVFLVKTCRALEEALESEGNEAAFGSRLCAQLTLFDLPISSWKTSQPSVHEAVKFFSPQYAKEAIGIDVGRLLRKTLARRISGHAGGCWPTPRSSPNENRQTKPTPSQLAGKHGNLSTAVRMFPPPRNNTGPSTDAKHLSLDGAVKMFPTPEASTRGQTPKYFKRGNPNLAAVATWTTPSVHGNYNRKGASKESGDGLATQVGGALNPTWVEWLMGFPLGWTACVDWVMRKSRSKRR